MASAAVKKRNLLLCFDAFGTLFSPKSPVAQQYAQVARQCGITGFTDDELQSHLVAAMKKERRENPNYGKDTGLGASQWWANVIQTTFKPFVPSNQALPPNLVPKLMHRFASSEGYNEESGLVPALRAFRRQNSRQRFEKVVIGVVTNSDDRVPSILSSFGLRVSPLRYGTTDESSVPPEEAYDIDFHCMSYDVGVEKPDSRIFEAAELMLGRRVMAKRSGEAPTPAELGSWLKVYVGDEHAKDVVGAANAGWNAVLLDSEGIYTEAEAPSLEDCSARRLDELFAEHAVVKVRSLQGLATWMTGIELGRR
ncbi:haloacid dehalogenase [Metarhizium rileyi]|uniref:Haloacid dehalogenase n=1 Tax=Metarhizium rileyi (strain RCEF 4871) TaxID=1649241 RepID=A0A167JJG3_METRR|nr:haloacid dehalogenase [Metarhizium rileyi RCEF 4871]